MLYYIPKSIKLIQNRKLKLDQHYPTIPITISRINMPKISAQSTRGQVVSQYNLRSRAKAPTQYNLRSRAKVTTPTQQQQQPAKKRSNLRSKEKNIPMTAEERHLFITKFTEDHMDSYLTFMAKYFPNGSMRHGLP